MIATYVRLGFALLFMAGIIIFNVHMVLTGAADDFYGHVPGTALQPVTHAPVEVHINSHVAVSTNDMPIQSSRFMPGHLIKRG
jgi:hypothetical protein